MHKCVGGSLGIALAFLDAMAVVLDLQQLVAALLDDHVDLCGACRPQRSALRSSQSTAQAAVSASRTLQ